MNTRQTSADQGATTTRPRSRGITRRFWAGFMRPLWRRFVLVVLFGALVSVANASFTWITGWVFAAFGQTSQGGRFTPPPTADEVMIWGPVMILATGFALALFQYAYAVVSQGTAVTILRDLQKAMFANFLRFDLAQSQGDGTGQLVSRFTNDVTILRESLTRGNKIFLDLLNLLVLLGAMAYYDWVLFLVILLIYPTIGYPVTVLGKILRRVARRVQDQIGGITQRLTETMRGADMVKTYNLQDQERAKADALFEERRRLLTKSIKARAANEPVITAIGAVAVAVVIGVAAWRVSNGLLDGATLISFIVALTLLSQPARSLGTLNAVLQEGFAALERVFWVIDRTPTVTDGVRAQLPMLDGSAAITLWDVQFAYEDGSEALAGVSLDVKRGQTVALVGESGSGKSTLLRLLPRLYDVTGGDIRINDVSIFDVPLVQLRGAIGFVSQSPVLFDETVADNIGFGDPGADRARIIQAAKDAAAHDFIEALPQGYDTRIGDAGETLSGGQRQRIAIARAFLKDAPILLLDEATSALDAESEQRVQEALARLTEGRTTLVVAHRLSTIRHADMICVLDKGRIVEAGTHEDLVARNGAYATLAKLQFGG